MTVLKLSEDGHLVLPEDMRRVLCLAAGDEVEVALEGRSPRVSAPTGSKPSATGIDIGPWLGRGRSFRSSAAVDRISTGFVTNGIERGAVRSTRLGRCERLHLSHRSGRRVRRGCTGVSSPPDRARVRGLHLEPHALRSPRSALPARRRRGRRGLSFADRDLRRLHAHTDRHFDPDRGRPASSDLASANARRHPRRLRSQCELHRVPVERSTTAASVLDRARRFRLNRRQPTASPQSARRASRKRSPLRFVTSVSASAPSGLQSLSWTLPLPARGGARTRLRCTGTGAREAAR